MPAMKWAHLDIAGTMDATRPSPYQEKGMTGRPVRFVSSFLVLRYHTEIDIFFFFFSLSVL